MKIRPENISETVAFIEQVWGKFSPDRPFEYSFLDQSIDDQYKAEAGLGRIFGHFSALAIFIACIGLFALAAFAAEQRTKEIGIRKVFGASVEKIVFLVSADFLKLIGISFVLAGPVAYVMMQRWLEGFAYRIDIGFAPFVTAGLGVFLIAWLTVGYQSAKAGLVDPARTLRYE